MKRRMNRHVALLLAVLMLFTSIGMNAIAVAEHTCTINSGNPNYCNVVNPTCDTQGYTEYLCVICKKPVSKGDYTAALGHQYNKIEYEVTPDGAAYYKYNKCVREYTKDGAVVAGCNSKVYETDDNGDRTLYKLVKFVNNKVTIGYNTKITYTNVATEPFASEELYRTFVKVGDEISYEATYNPYREKTVHYGSFKCIGWSTDDSLEATAQANLTADNCDDLAMLTEKAKGRDIVLYPVFQGVDKVYEVVFYNNNLENLTWSQKVNHGECPKYSDPYGILYPDPPKAEDLMNYYKFNGWSPKTNQTSGILTAVIESTPAYDNLYYHPTYEPVAKRFVIEFYDEAGENLLFSKEGIDLEENFLTYEPEDGQDNPYKEILDYSLNELTKDSDSVYRYAWAGWQVLREDNSKGTKVVTIDKYGEAKFHGFSGIVANDVINVVDEEGNTVYLDGELPKGYVAEGEPDKEPKKVIRLVPVFTQTRQTYAVDVEMQLPTGEDKDYYKGEADVHIEDKNGQLVASGLTNNDGKFRCRLDYRLPFTVTVATYDGKYIGTATINSLSHVYGGDDVEAEINKCMVKMELNPEYEKHCGCIHHNALLQPIVVRIFNILYTFFNYKFVCCYDMYSTIGPLLDYTK